MREFYGKILWKTEESQRITGLVFWILAVTGIYLSPVSKALDGVGLHLDALVLFSAMVSTGFLAVLLFGHFIDKMRLWEPDWEAKTKRNPYDLNLLRPKERTMLRNQLQLFKGLKGLADSEKYNDALAELKQWVASGEVG